MIEIAIFALELGISMIRMRMIVDELVHFTRPLLKIVV